MSFWEEKDQFPAAACVQHSTSSLHSVSAFPSASMELQSDEDEDLLGSFFLLPVTTTTNKSETHTLVTKTQQTSSLTVL